MLCQTLSSGPDNVTWDPLPCFSSPFLSGIGIILNCSEWPPSSCSSSSYGNKITVARSNFTPSYLPSRSKERVFLKLPRVLGISLPFLLLERQNMLLGLSRSEPASEQGVWSRHIQWEQNRTERGACLRGKSSYRWMVGGNGGLDVNNKCSLQQLVAPCWLTPFITHLDFIFFCHKVTWGSQWLMSVLVAGWIKSQMILWSPSPCPGSLSPKQGAGSDGWHLAHRPPHFLLGPTADIIHQSQDFFLCSPDVALETYLKQHSGQPQQMYWCWQVR